MQGMKWAELNVGRSVVPATELIVATRSWQSHGCTQVAAE